MARKGQKFTRYTEEMRKEVLRLRLRRDDLLPRLMSNIRQNRQLILPNEMIFDILSSEKND